MDIYTFIVMLHVIGTILGTGGATIAELQITRALKNKQVSDDERALMHVNYTMIRAGMGLLLVSVIGMYWYLGLETLVASDKLLIKDLMFAAIFINAVALHKRWVPLWLGASTSFVSWWGATLLGLAGQLPYSFVTYLIGYVVAILVFAGISNVLRSAYERGQLTGQHVKGVSGAILLVVLAALYFLISGDERARQAAEEANREPDTPAQTSVVETEPADRRTLSEVVNFEYPGGEHNVEIALTLDEDDVITDVSVADIDPENNGRFPAFEEAVSELVVGQPLPELTLQSRVGGASLTTDAWNEAVDRMQAQLDATGV